MIQRDAYEIAAGTVRAFLEPVWGQWHAASAVAPDIPSRWTCGRSSWFLQRVFEDDLGLPAVWKSGTPRHSPSEPDLGPYGFDAGGRWESHAWVVVDIWLIDITADQFGAAPVIVTSIADPRYSEGADTALPEYQARRQDSVDGLWPIWLASGLRAALSRERSNLRSRFAGR